MGSLDSLKALLAKKKQEKQELVGDKKYVRKAELEEARLKRLREEEEAERRAKEEKRRKLLGASGGGRPATPTDGAPTDGGAAAAGAAAAGAAGASAADGGSATAALPRDEAIRRLRALGQPATLFGEDDADRLARLRKVERTVSLVDEARGGQQENILLQLKRQEKQLSKQQQQQQQQAKAAAGSGGEAARESAATDGPSQVAGGGDGGGDAATGSGDAAAGAGAGAGGAGAGDDVLAAFKEAAARLAAQREEEALPIEDRIVRMLRRWCAMWEDDLEARSDEVKRSGAGSQATMVFRQSMTYFEPLYERLKRRQLEEELKVGLWVIIQHMHDRNYLAANDVYLKLAIGNAPWPIGVTQVGLHERSAREKISHSMNSTSQAHIMNDEATRKFFQAVKRLMTALQRLRPTDPSRSVDFDVAGDEGRGAAGGGSNRAALLLAAAKGELPAALPAAPHHVAPDGSVRIPPKWENVLRRHAVSLGIEDFGAGADGGDSDDEPGGGGGGSGRGGRSGGGAQQQQQQQQQAKTPPRSPLKKKVAG